jgi:hypothetical protein
LPAQSFDKGKRTGAGRLRVHVIARPAAAQPAQARPSASCAPRRAIQRPPQNSPRSAIDVIVVLPTMK